MNARLPVFPQCDGTYRVAPPQREQLKRAAAIGSDRTDRAQAIRTLNAVTRSRHLVQNCLASCTLGSDNPTTP